MQFIVAFHSSVHTVHKSLWSDQKHTAYVLIKKNAKKYLSLLLKEDKHSQQQFL